MAPRYLSMAAFEVVSDYFNCRPIEIVRKSKVASLIACLHGRVGPQFQFRRLSIRSKLNAALINAK